MGLPLAIRDLRVTGPSGRVLLAVGALDVPPGSLVGVRGPSGAGKSTLLYALGGLLTATGTVRWGDTELLGLSDERRTAFRAAQIGMIFQDFLLFEELGALDNAALSAAFAPRTARAALRDRAANWLDRLGLAQTGTRRADSFSGGERQRIAVARALSNDPAVILADEPTASLDRATADRLIDDLVALSQDSGRTLIAVTHDEALASRLDRVLTMADGRVVEDSDG